MAKEVTVQMWVRPCPALAALIDKQRETTLPYKLTRAQWLLAAAYEKTQRDAKGSDG